jgi:hypothetical protein
VSFILDALKKLEREKQSGEPGVVVVGHVPWGGGDGRRRLAVVAVAAVLTALLIAVGAWWLLRSTPPSPPSPALATPLTRSGSAPAVAPSIAPSPAPSTTTDVRSPPAASNASAIRPGPPLPPGLALPGPTTAASAASPSEETRPAPPAPELRLNAISVRDGRPIALINDRLVREGDSFDGVRVLHIGESEVEVEIRGQRRVIRF